MPRQQQRISYLSDITLEGSSGRRQVRISDLSLGGCFVDSISAFSEGEEIKLHISDATGRVMEFDGKVAWLSGGAGFGVNFVDMDDEQVKFLRSIIEG